MITVNGKFIGQKTTGVQRYVIEILKCWDEDSINYEIKGIPGRFKSLSEQLITVKKDSTLWCPTNTAPIFIKNKIVTLHDCAVFYNPDWFSRKYRYWRKFIIPKIINSSMGIITVSNFSKELICETFNLDEDFVKVIPNGINLDSFKKIESVHSLNLIKKFNIDTPYFLTVGSIDPRKNIDKLLCAWDIFVNSGNRDFKLVIVGGRHSNFKSSSHKVLKNVIFTDYVEEVELKALYQNAFSFVFPSLFEGFGLPILEAMCFDVPVISSNATAIPEVGKDKVLYFDPNSAEEIASAMQMLIDNRDLHAELVKNCQAHIKHYSWKKCSSETYRYLKEFD